MWGNTVWTLPTGLADVVVHAQREINPKEKKRHSVGAHIGPNRYSTFRRL